VAPGGAYGDFRDPNHLGSGGGGSSVLNFGNLVYRAGGNGGGLVRIVADTLTLNGQIVADGSSTSLATTGGGSGGGIRIDTRVLSGSGLIRAAGGASTNNAAGGGGGRVAVYYEDRSGFSGSISASGGAKGTVGTVSNDNNGGAGTVFLKDTVNQAFGELIVDNGGKVTVGNSTPLRAVGTGTSTSLTANELEDSIRNFPLPNASTGAVGLVGLELRPDANQSIGFRIANNTAKRLFTDPLDGDMTTVTSVGATYIGVYNLDEISVTGGARVVTADDIDVTGAPNVDAASLLQSHNLILP
jgi:hypothetical protein